MFKTQSKNPAAKSATDQQQTLAIEVTLDWDSQTHDPAETDRAVIVATSVPTVRISREQLPFETGPPNENPVQRAKRLRLEREHTVDERELTLTPEQARTLARALGGNSEQTAVAMARDENGLWDLGIEVIADDVPPSVRVCFERPHTHSHDWEWPPFPWDVDWYHVPDELSSILVMAVGVAERLHSERAFIPTEELLEMCRESIESELPGEATLRTATGARRGVLPLQTGRRGSKPNVRVATSTHPLDARKGEQ